MVGLGVPWSPLNPGFSPQLVPISISSLRAQLGILASLQPRNFGPPATCFPGSLRPETQIPPWSL